MMVVTDAGDPRTPSRDAFDASALVYDAVYAARGKDYAREVEYVRQILDRDAAPMRRSLLDVACGTGEHLRHLAAHYDVTGLDLNRAMLNVAREKLPDVPLIRADMTDVDLGRTFDRITCFFASIAYLPSVAAMTSAIGCMARHLADDGVMVIEPGVAADRVEPPSRSEMDLRAGLWSVHRVTDAQRDGNTLRIRFDYELSLEGVPGRQRFSETHIVQLFNDDDFEQAFNAAGLQAERDPVGPAGMGVWRAWP